MAIVLEITDLSYKDFSNINLSFKDKTYYSIIGSNNSGKTTLFKLISGIIPSNNSISCMDTLLNRKEVNDYITKLGIVSRVNKNSFIYKYVFDEMMYPLTNLGYSYNKSLNRINEILELFNKTDILKKSINELDIYDQQLLLIMISLLHRPRVLLLDSVLELFSQDKYIEILKVFKKLVNDGLCIITFTNNSDIAYSTDRIVVIDNKKIIGKYKPSDIYNNDNIFTDHNIELPFLVDLSLKLKMYNLINKEYSDMKEMVDDIWP